MKPDNAPKHNRVACCVCGRAFPRPWHMVREGMHTCPECSRPTTIRGGYEPMVQIEAGEHQRLLHLYYALFEHDMAPSRQSATNVRQAMARCNRFFEGGSPCQQ